MFLNIVACSNIYKLGLSDLLRMKELIIQVRINGNQTATAVQKKGFDEKESASTTFEVIGILQNIIKIEQEKLDSQTTTMMKNG